MYGPRFIRIGPCATQGCKRPPTILIYEPYEWDGMEHETNRRFMCEQCANKFFVSAGYETIKEQEQRGI
jgi:hypothetical protein